MGVIVSSVEEVGNTVFLRDHAKESTHSYNLVSMSSKGAGSNVLRGADVLRLGEPGRDVQRAAH
jgi:hypothetical protein